MCDNCQDKTTKTLLNNDIDDDIDGMTTGDVIKCENIHDYMGTLQAQIMDKVTQMNKTNRDEVHEFISGYRNTKRKLDQHYMVFTETTHQ